MKPMSEHVEDDKTKKRPFKVITLDIVRKGARQYLVQSIESGLRAGLTVFKIRLKKADIPVFPSACVSIAGVMDFYAREKGCAFLSSGSVMRNGYLSRTGFLSPKCLSDFNSSRNSSFLDRVWKFTSDDEYNLVTGIIQSLREKVVFGPGTLEGVELCLHEVMDNVLNHSVPYELTDGQAPVGYVMVQCNAENGSLSLAVYDNGQGIWQSFAESDYTPTTHRDAIELALQKNVTGGHGAGRGMWMLARVVETCGGALEVSSGSAKYQLMHSVEREKVSPSVVEIGSDIIGTTLVDFRLNTNKSIDLVAAFEGYEPTNLWHESHEQDDTTLVFDVAKESRGVGTRYDARRFRNVIRNAHEDKKQKVVLDFASVEVMSSSYADELLGCLIDDIGHVRFMEGFSLRNLSSLNTLIVDKALASHAWKNK